LESLQEQQHRDIDRQNNEQSADQRGFDKFSNRSHLGLAPNRFIGDGPSSTTRNIASGIVARNLEGII
jgi:hypothetical protein